MFHAASTATAPHVNVPCVKPDELDMRANPARQTGRCDVTPTQSEIIRHCISVLWEIESGQEDAKESEQAFLARLQVENFWHKYRPEQPGTAS